MASLESRALARTVLSLWKQYHTDQKRKWRDSLRARVHFRLERTKSVLRKMKEVTVKAAQAKHNEVRIHANHLVCLQHRALQTLILQVIERRKLCRMLQEADHFRDYNSRKRGLLGWFQYIEIKAWAFNQTRKAVVFWCGQMVKKGWGWFKEGVAEAQFGHVLKSQSYFLLIRQASKKFIRRLKALRMTKRNDKYMELKAMNYHKRSRLRKALLFLDLNVNYIRDQKYMQHMALKKYGHTLKKLGLGLFVKYHRHCNIELELSMKVQEFRGKTKEVFDLRHGFKGFKDNCNLAKWHMIEQAACREFRVKHDFDRMIQGCLREQDAAYSEARQWHLYRLKKSTFRAIIEFKQVKLDSRQKIEDAEDVYHFDVLLPRVMKAWKVYTVGSLRKRRQEERADDLYDYRLADKMLRVWLSKFSGVQNKKQADSLAQQQYGARLGRLVLRHWVQFTDMKKLSHIAISHRQAFLKRQTLLSWQQAVQKKLTLLDLQSDFEQFLKKKRLKSGFTELLELLQNAKAYRRKAAMAHRYRQRKLKCMVFDSYHKYVTSNWDSIGKIRAAKETSKGLTCKRVLRGMRQVVAKQSRVKTLERKVAWKRSNRIISKAYFDWKYLYDQIYLERLEEAERLERAVSALDSSKARRMLQRLKDYRNSKRIDKLKWESAESWHNKSLCKVGWLHLRLHIHRRRSKDSRLRLSASHYQTNLKRMALEKLVEYLRDQQLAHYMHVSALKAWSKRLYKRVWNGWALHTELRKAKAQKEIEALELRKRDMLKDIVGNWIRVGLEWRTMRDQAAREFMLQTEEKKMRLARKYARRWLEATIRKRTGSPLPYKEKAEKPIKRAVVEPAKRRSPIRPSNYTLTNTSPRKPQAEEATKLSTIPRKRTAPRPLNANQNAANIKGTSSAFSLSQFQSIKPVTSHEVLRQTIFEPPTFTPDRWQRPQDPPQRDPRLLVHDYSSTDPWLRVQQIEAILLDFKFDREKLELFKAQLEQDPSNVPLQTQTLQLRDKLQRAMPTIRQLHDEIQSLKQVC
mmetsp:Transcript_27402/g.49323  ORF Transcript_27402/g.49323 Transcript_27402/m.49323 type:complete len:1026 (+) Transcript_27402:95-3172(+)